MNTISLVFLELLAKSVVLLSLAAAIVWSMRRASAAQRHVIWFTAFVALLVMPFTKMLPAAWTFSWEKPISAQPSALPELPPATSEIIARNFIIPADAAANTPKFTLPNWKPTLVAVWILGTALILGHRILGSVLLSKLIRRSQLVEDDRLYELLESVSAALNCNTRVELRESPRCCVPITWGISKHTILVPADMKAWPESRIVAAFRHEFGHIMRRDYITRIGVTLAQAIYWPNPLVWVAAKRLHITQEQAADDLVLRSGTASEEYATLLFDAARQLVNSPLPSREAIAMAQPSTLETRITAIIEDRDRKPAPRSASLWASVSGFAALLVFTAAQLQSADSNKPAPAAPPIERQAIPELENPTLTKAAKKAADIIIPRVEFKNATLAEAVDFMDKKSKQLDASGEGVNFVVSAPAPDVKIDLNRGNISLSHTIRYVALQANLQFRFEENGVVLEPLPKPNGIVLPLTTKANTLIIPRLELRNVTIREALEFLKTKSVAVDPEGKGINIVFTALPDSPDLITLALNHVPVSEAMKYICNLGNLTYELQEHAVVVSLAGVRNAETVIVHLVIQADLFIALNGRAPETMGDMVRKPDAAKYPKWRQLLADDPKDPWGSTYVLEAKNRSSKYAYDLFSCGPDRQPHTPDDIGNW